MSTRIKQVTALTVLAAGSLGLATAQPAPTQPNLTSSQQTAAQNCPASHDRLVDALKKSVKASGGPSNGGFDNNEWASVVARDGTVCAVAFSGNTVGDQWPGSRAISAEKANTANAFSLKAAAISTANLYAGAQPGGFLFGIVTTAPVFPDIGSGDESKFGSGDDAMIGKRVGGVVVFGGGLALITTATWSAVSV